MYWSPGDQIVVRSVWDRKIRAAWPDTVVNDSEHLLAVYLAGGTKFKQTKTRFPVGTWSLIDDIWTADLLLLIVPGEAHSVLLFWEGRERVFDRWYVNLQTPFERTPIGIDFTDHFLDIIVNADLSSWKMKDEDELREAVSLGLVTPDLERKIRSEGESVVRQIDARSRPFSDGWEMWRPDPTWPIPTLPPGWDEI